MTREVERVSDSCYSNQTQSKHYSQVSAELRADGLRKHATVRVVERDRYFVTEAALPDELEVEVLRRLPGLTMREWLKRCMQLGANPRVYNPFLPHGTEERLGLDHFGNDVEKHV
jgi:hypothetical protein